MMEGAREIRIAHVQDQALRAVRPSRGHRGRGRSGGFRTIVVFRRGEPAFFVHGFAKSDRENLRRKELSGLRSLANEYLALDAAGLAAAQSTGAIVEVECDDQAV